MIRQIKKFISNNIAYTLVVGMLLIIATFTTIKDIQEGNRISRSGVFVIGRIVNVRHRRGTSIEYEYNFGGERFHSSEGILLKDQSIGATYLVKVNPKAPSESRLLKEYYLTDSIRLEQPDSGWQKNPLDRNDSSGPPIKE